MSHSNWPSVLLFDSANKQYNSIIKGWFHYLTSESKGIFFVNNKLIFGSAWCLVTAQIQISLIKKIKIWRPEHSLTVHPIRPISYFYLTPPLKLDVICVSPLKNTNTDIFAFTTVSVFKLLSRKVLFLNRNDNGNYYNRLLFKKTANS